MKHFFLFTLLGIVFSNSFAQSPCQATLTSAVGTNSQTVCVNSPVTNITYQVSGNNASVAGLPPGVTGSYSANVFAITGTPSSNATAGIYNYTVTTTGGCSPDASVTGRITVNPLPTATIAGNTTICQNVSPPYITFTGANGTPPYTFTYNTNGGTTQFVINSGAGSATASVAVHTETIGAFTYSLIAVEDGFSCYQNHAGGATVNVVASPLISVTSATICEGSSTTLTASGASTYQWSTGETTGSITQSPSTTTTYTVTGNTSGCSSSAAGTITVISSMLSSTLSPPAINSGATFTYTPTSATGGATFSWNRATVVGISEIGTSGQGSVSEILTNTTGSPVNVTYTYTTTANGCSNVENVVVTVNSSGQSPCQASLTSATGTDAQTVCNNSPITDITYQVSGTITYMAGLPSGLIGVSSTNVFTISGTPTESGTFNYTVTTTGGCSPDTFVTGVLTIGGGLIASGGSNTQSICQNSAITPIKYIIVGGTAQTNGLPAGISSVMNATNDTLTISGTPTVNGMFNYTVSTSGGSCPSSSAFTGSITVAPSILDSSISTQTVCQNSAILDVVFNFSPGITYTVTPLPAGVTSSFDVNNNMLTISGAPTVSGVFDYSVTSYGSCSSSITTGTITVSPLPTASIAGATTVCLNTPSPVITFTGYNGTPPYTFTYNLNGGVRQTVTTAASGNSVTVLVTTTVVGNYTYTLIGVQDASSAPCSEVQSGSAVVTVTSLPSASVSGTTFVCHEAIAPNVTFIGNNGFAPYIFTFNINGGPNLALSTSSESNTVTISAPTNNLGAFVYNLTGVQDATASSCGFASGNSTITVVPFDYNTSILTTNISFLNACDGYLEVVSTATPPVTYLWNDSNTDSIRNNVCAGTYTVTVTDSSGCIAQAQAQVGSNSTPSTTPNPLTLSVMSTDATSVDSCNGSATAVISGGTVPYTMSFANYTGGDSVHTFTNLCPGFYTINASDNANNTTSFTFVVGSPATTFTNTPIDPAPPVDTLVTDAIQNCDIDYDAINTLQITSFVFVGTDSIDVSWAITDSTGGTITTSAMYVFTLNGLYTLVLDIFCTNRSSGSIKGVDQLYIDRASAINTIELEGVIIYPNPFSDQLTLLLTEYSTISITTVSGVEVYTGTASAGISNMTTSNLSPGVYLVTIVNSKGSYTKKIVKE